MHGWFIIDKPQGLTSAQVVGKVKRMLNLGRRYSVGHAGTLDPLATGILPVAVGEATKTMPYVQDAGKAYRFTARFGIATDTDDAEGSPVQTDVHIPTPEEITAVLHKFTGDITQIPPIYSAIKINGQRAYALARQGQTPTLKPREVTIYSLQLIEQQGEDSFSFEVSCSKGTYVRAIARDMAAALGTTAHITALRRTACKKFTEADTILLENLQELAYKGALAEALLPVQAALDDILVLALEPADAAKVSHGNSVPVIGHPGEKDAYAVAGNSVLALGKISHGMFVPKRVLVY